MSGAIRKCLINEWSHRGGAIRRGLDELHFTRRRRGGARPGSTRGPVRFSPWLSPALHPALSPFVPYCSLPVQFSRPLCLGSLTSAVSLIRASQPLQQRVGAPSPGMAPDKQLETLVTESVISKGKAERTTRSQGEQLIISHIATGGPSTLPSSLCNWNPGQQCLHSTKLPFLVPRGPQPLQAIGTESIPVIYYIKWKLLRYWSPRQPGSSRKQAFCLRRPAQSLGNGNSVGILQ